MTRCVLKIRRSNRRKSTRDEGSSNLKKARPLLVNCPLPLGEGGAERRVRAARSTILIIDAIVGRACPHPALQATFSRWEKDPPSLFVVVWVAR
jgi:hypothetical protein